jgi:hypothetical protein
MHQLADFHDHSKHYSIWPGQDYSNPRIRDFVEGMLIYKSLYFLSRYICNFLLKLFFFLKKKKFIVENWAKTLVDKKQTARMPWHDIAVGFVSIHI